MEIKHITDIKLSDNNGSWIKNHLHIPLIAGKPKYLKIWNTSKYHIRYEEKICKYFKYNKTENRSFEIGRM